MTARVLLADCPWRFGDRLPGPSRGAERHYSTLSAEELEHFALPPIADNALLFLWRVASMQAEALRVMSAWGFVLKTEIVWKKLTRSGKPWFGMGRTVRASHETCLIGWRGRPAIKARNVRSVFEAKVPSDGNGYVHSAKPDEFYAIVETLSDGPYTELFARRRRDGWVSLGNQVASS